ncbi:hypothetical protein BDZ45DRAFT_755551 [Acephala macrosclerotiorum]|nr:hypothetical protein BDZ45DRAFT_755551 [Acephala macrosclerotiorum]
MLLTSPQEALKSPTSAFKDFLHYPSRLDVSEELVIMCRWTEAMAPATRKLNEAENG